MPPPTQTTPVNVVRFHQDTLQESSSVDAACSISHVARIPGTVRRYTPHIKTPTSKFVRNTPGRWTGDHTKKRKTRITPDSARGSDEQTPDSARGSDEQTPDSARGSDEQTLKELLNKTWRVYRSSPLYKFDHAASALRHYSRVLSAHLQAEAQKNQAFVTENDQANLALFSVFKGLKKFQEADAIQITLKQKPKQGDGEPRVVLTAIMCCVHASEDIIPIVSDPFTYLPVVLARGTVGLSRCLTEWLQMQFDCVVNLVTFPSIALSWMVAMWAGSTPADKKGRSVELRYKVPEEVEGLDAITLDINPLDCKYLWECVHTDENAHFLEDEVCTFIKALEEHFYHYFRVCINAMPLDRVGTSIALIDSEGRLKIYSADHIHQVLSHVTEVIMEQTNILC